jgi:hypothetical protein
VGKVVPRLVDEVVGALVGDDLAVDGEQLPEIALRVGQQQRADARRLVEAHVVGVVLRLGDVTVECDPRLVEKAVHLDPPGFAAVAAPDRRPRRLSAEVVSPELDGQLAAGT